MKAFLSNSLRRHSVADSGDVSVKRGVSPSEGKGSPTSPPGSVAAVPQIPSTSQPAKDIETPALNTSEPPCQRGSAGGKRGVSRGAAIGLETDTGSKHASAGMPLMASGPQEGLLYDSASESECSSKDPSYRSGTIFVAPDTAGLATRLATALSSVHLTEPVDVHSPRSPVSEDDRDPAAAAVQDLLDTSGQGARADAPAAEAGDPRDQQHSATAWRSPKSPATASSGPVCPLEEKEEQRQTSHAAASASGRAPASPAQRRDLSGAASGTPDTPPSEPNSPAAASASPGSPHRGGLPPATSSPYLPHVPVFAAALQASLMGSVTNTPPSASVSAECSQSQDSFTHLAHDTRRGSFNLAASAPSTSSGPAAVPKNVYYDFPSVGGAVALPRWGHSASAIGDKLYVYGGVGSKVYDDIHAFDASTNTWTLLTPISANRKERPLEMFGHASAASGNTIWVFGGRQGRRYLRKLCTFNTETLYWRVLKETEGTPPACAGLSLTAVGAHGILAFGGQGKKCFDAVHRLNPNNAQWQLMRIEGVGPSPRYGHSAAWDGSDRLIIFGGANGTVAFNDVRVLSLRHNAWATPVCSGAVPSPRSNHSAVMFAPGLMMVFGGCTTQGTFLNDTYILDCTTFVWHRPVLLGSGPVARYSHSCNMVGSRVVLFGGSNAAQVFDGVVYVSTDFGRELELVAAELACMSGRGGRGEDRSMRTGQAMQVQLAELLARRGAQETQQRASKKAEIAEALFQAERKRSQALTAELEHLRVLLAEEEEAHRSTRRELAAERERLARGERLSMQQLAEAADRIDGLEEEVAEKRQLSAKLTESRSKCEALLRRCWECEDASVALQSRLTVQERELAAVVAECERLKQQQRATAGSSSNSSSAVPGAAVNARVRGGGDAPSPSDASSSGDPAATGGMAGGAMAAAAWGAALATAGSISRADEQQSGAALSRDEQEEVVRTGVACLQGDAAALVGRPLEQLRRLELGISRAWKAVHDTISAATAADLMACERQLRELAHAAEESATCSLCMEHPKGIVFNCGHQVCRSCSAIVSSCPYCRQLVTARITLFKS